jgi:hypothetical protein
MGITNIPSLSGLVPIVIKLRQEKDPGHSTRQAVVMVLDSPGAVNKYRCLSGPTGKEKKLLIFLATLPRLQVERRVGIADERRL